MSEDYKIEEPLKSKKTSNKKKPNKKIKQIIVVENNINNTNNKNIDNESSQSNKTTQSIQSEFTNLTDSNTKENKNSIKNKVWTHIFNEIGYTGNTDIIITAEQIKKSNKTWKGENNQFEPRLLCKQDSDKDRPSIFREYEIYIISIKNGEYLLTKNSIYYKLTYPKCKVTEINYNDDSILLSLGNSESSLIDNLRYSGLFEKKQYLGEKIEFGPLLNGRHRCSFKTKIGNKEVDVSGSQYETDACYESKSKILLIECKGINKLKSFNIRQLYYPFRSIYDKVKDKKQIITIFINKDKDDIIHIWKFEFVNPLELTSIKNIGYHKYQFD